MFNRKCVAKVKHPSFAPSKSKSIPASVEQVDSLSPEGVSPEVNILMSTKRERLRADVWMLNGFLSKLGNVGRFPHPSIKNETKVSGEILVNCKWGAEKFWCCHEDGLVFFFFWGGELRFQNFKL